MDRLAGLIICTTQGDRKAFRLLHDLTAPALFSVIVKVLANRAEAEEVLQDTFVLIWEKAGTFDAARGRPMTWLMTVARNSAISRLRKRSKITMIDLDHAREIPDRAPLADKLVFATREARLLEKLLNSLPANVGATIRAAYFDGYTYNELAKRDQMSVATLKSWVRRGLLKMRSDLSALESDGIAAGALLHP